MYCFQLFIIQPGAGKRYPWVVTAFCVCLPCKFTGSGAIVQSITQSTNWHPIWRRWWVVDELLMNCWWIVEIKKHIDLSFLAKKNINKSIEMFNFNSVKQLVESITVQENFDQASTTTASPMVLLITTIIYFMLILTFGAYLWNNVLAKHVTFIDSRTPMTASHILGISILINLLKA